MEQVGHVLKIKGDIAEVEVKRITACGHSCDNCSGTCSTPGIVVPIQNILNAKEGDYVEITTETKNLMKYTLITYMMPFAMLLSGIFISMHIFKSLNISNYEGYSFLVGLIFLGISCLILRKVDKNVAKNQSLKFEMVRILD